MDEKDFNAYMSGERVPANTWESALMICEVHTTLFFNDIKLLISIITFSIIYFHVCAESALNVRRYNPP